MTLTQERNSSICAAMHMLTQDQPQTKSLAGSAVWLFTMGELRITASEIGGETLLDAWFADERKVASFRGFCRSNRVPGCLAQGEDAPRVASAAECRNDLSSCPAGSALNPHTTVATTADPTAGVYTSDPS